MHSLFRLPHGKNFCFSWASIFLFSSPAFVVFLIPPKFLHSNAILHLLNLWQLPTFFTTFFILLLSPFFFPLFQFFFPPLRMLLLCWYFDQTFLIVEAWDIPSFGGFIRRKRSKKQLRFVLLTCNATAAYQCLLLEVALILCVINGQYLWKVLPFCLDFYFLNSWLDCLS